MSIRFLLIFTIVFSTINTKAQQNFFNVPSSDITKKSDLFFQEQLNLTTEATQSSTTFCYGLGKNLEIGFNLIGMNLNYQRGIDFEDDNQPYAPYLSLNLQKAFPLSEKLKFSIGGQSGFNRSSKFGYYVYSNLGLNLHELHAKIILGTYLSNSNYFGPGNANLFSANSIAVPIQFGIEKSIIKDKLLFQADFISGKHAMGEAVIGFAYFMNKNWILSSGYQIPNDQSMSNKALVFELTYLPN